MNIFSNLKIYSQPKRSNVTSEPEQSKSKFHLFKEKLFEYLPSVGIYLALLSISGLIWYYGNVAFFGFVFWGLVSLGTFIIITPGFAHLTDLFEKKFGENIGLSLGCLGSASGIIIAITIFVSTIPYWDYEKQNYKVYSPTVYWTRYGECYHSTPECFHIEGHKIYQGSEYKAEEKDLRPCSDCY